MNDEVPTLLLLVKNAITVASLKKMLSPHYQLVVVDDADSAWRYLTQLTSPCIVLAEMAAALDEFGLMERLNDAQDSLLRAIPVLLLVGADDEDEREQAIDYGAADFINVPFSSQELLSRLRLHGREIEKLNPDDLASTTQEISMSQTLQLTQQESFNLRLTQELSFSFRHHVHLSIALLRIDKYDVICKRFEKADVLYILNAVAEVLQITIRREDLLCYRGNGAFLILMPSTNSLGAIAGIKRIREGVKKHRVRVQGKKLPVSFSGGIYSSLGGKHIRPEDVYAELDQKMEKALEGDGDTIISAKPSEEKSAISVDWALKKIARGETGELEKDAGQLLQAVMPVLEFADEQLPVELGEINQYLKIYFDV